MAIDFEIPQEAKEIREKVRRFVQEECIPAEEQLEHRPYKEVLADLRFFYAWMERGGEGRGERS